MPSDNSEPAKGQPRMSEAALFGLCPNCGARTLFGGLTKFADHCRVCSLDFTKFNVGDGPAAFLIMIVNLVAIDFRTTILGSCIAVDPTDHRDGNLWFESSQGSIGTCRI
jgi:uncharacterized protein (DUF983 family)